MFLYLTFCLSYFMENFINKIKKYSYSVVDLRKYFLDKEYFAFIVLNAFILVVIFFEFIFILNFVSESDSRRHARSEDSRVVWHSTQVSDASG